MSSSSYKLFRKPLIAIGFVFTLFLNQAFAQTWVSAWGTSITGTSSLSASNFSCRWIARATLGGSGVRLRLSNVFGDAPITFAAVTVGIRTNSANVNSTSTVTFAGSNSVTINTGQEISSDYIDLPISAQTDLAVTLYVPGSIDSFPYHTEFTSQYCSTFDGSAGDHTEDSSGSAFTSVATTIGWLTAIDVVAPDSTSAAISAIGDSITDGYNVATDSYGGWTDVLSQRLNGASSDRSILNAGISGNTVFQNGGNGVPAVSRFGRDVLEQSGLAYVILFEGTNDINLGASAADLESNLTSLANTAHAEGLGVIGATITPRHNGWSGDQDSKDSIRDAVNQWIRATSVYDKYIDFDAVIRDPNAPEQMNSTYLNAAMDWIHPNVQGYAAMANAIDLSIFSANKIIVRDPSFEQSSSGSFANGWFHYGASGSGGVDVNASKAHTGNNDGWIFTTSPNWTGAAQNVMVTANTNYTLSAWFTCSQNFGKNAYLGISDQNGGSKSEVNWGDACSSTQYNQYSVQFNSGSLTQMQVYMGFNNGQSGGSWILIDDVQVTPR
ncbi:Putative secreted protein [Acidisarcina polymorpha]|uniref:Secreted protein n=1 Tax=Acidisarcina polymorpha TaxID=2211140 RepID=A0A2Z5G5X8_9BACT|nr:GDSL-type esterase/lipase family protein [Acidisarcina polymorpha]AXC13956.1 Putative secreted protein [Acidisarcina polymorpha]